MKYMQPIPREQSSSRSNSLASAGLKIVRPISFFLILSLGSITMYSQDDQGRKVKPTSSGTSDIREIEKRERESAQKPARKKVENQNLIYPTDLPVPKGAKGKTFRPPTVKKKRAREVETND